MDTSNSEIEDIRILLNNTRDEINISKSMQWKITNYVVLIYSGILGMNVITKFESFSIFGISFQFLTYVAIWVSSLVGVAIIISTERRIVDLRKLIRKINESMSIKYNDLIKELNEKYPNNFVADINLILIIFNLISAFLVTMTIFYMTIKKC